MSVRGRQQPSVGVERITGPGFRFTGRPGSEGDAACGGSTGRGPVVGWGYSARPGPRPLGPPGGGFVSILCFLISEGLSGRVSTLSGRTLRDEDSD